MKTRVVPASELDPKKGLRATDYIPEAAAKEHREKRIKALARLLTAQAEYLRNSGWVPLAPKTPGAPLWWQDGVQGGARQRQDIACGMQEERDNDVVYKD